jgi:FkbM family methyltransferase
LKGIQYSAPANFVKRGIAELLINRITGNIIRSFARHSIQRDGISIDVRSHLVSNKTIASFFFNSYESSERRFIRKYLRKDLPVIEIGSSIGIVSTLIGKMIEQPLYCIEANPQLIPIIEQHLRQNRIKNYQVFNYAVGDSTSDYLYFEKGETNIHGKVFKRQTENSVPVPVTSISAFKSQHEIDNFVLVSDIEGAEIYILENDLQSLRSCQQIIIETHDTRLNGVEYKYHQLKDLIIGSGFKLIDSYGPNYVFCR